MSDERGYPVRRLDIVPLLAVLLAACASSPKQDADAGGDGGDSDTDTDSDSDTDDGYQESGTYGPWSFERIAGGQGGHTVVVDDDGTVHTLVSSGAGLAHFRGGLGSWESEPVAADNGFRARLAFDSEGHAHVCYSLPGYNPEGGCTLRYATDAAGSWTTEVLAAADGDNGRGCYIGVDSADHVHIAHFVSAEVRRFGNEDGPWAEELVGSSISIQNEFPMVVATDDHLHAVFHNPAEAIAHYFGTPGAWESEVAVAGTESGGGGGLSAAVDPAGHMHLSFCRYPDGTSYATDSSGEWVVETVDPQGDTSGWGQSWIALDADGNPHVAYKASSWSLRYGSRATGEWAVETVHPADEDHQLATDVSLAIDADGYAHIVYFNLAKNDVWYATNTP